MNIYLQDGALIILRGSDGKVFKVSAESSLDEVTEALTVVDASHSNFNPLILITTSIDLGSSSELLSFIDKLLNKFSEEERAKILEKMLTYTSGYKSSIYGSSGYRSKGNALMYALQNQKLHAVAAVLEWMRMLSPDVQVVILGQDSGADLTTIGYALTEVRRYGDSDERYEKRKEISSGIRATQTKVILGNLQSLPKEALSQILLKKPAHNNKNILQMTIKECPMLSLDVLALVSGLDKGVRSEVLSVLSGRERAQIVGPARSEVRHLLNPAHQCYALFERYAGNQAMVELLGIADELCDLSAKHPEALMARAMIARESGDTAECTRCCEALKALSTKPVGFSLASLFKRVTDKEVSEALLAATPMRQDRDHVNEFIAAYPDAMLAVEALGSATTLDRFGLQ